MTGWVGLVGWPIADGLPTSVVTRQLQVERKTAKERWPETDVLQLSHVVVIFCFVSEINLIWFARPFRTRLSRNLDTGLDFQDFFINNVATSCHANDNTGRSQCSSDHRLNGDRNSVLLSLQATTEKTDSIAEYEIFIKPNKIYRALAGLILNGVRCSENLPNSNQDYIAFLTKRPIYIDHRWLDVGLLESEWQTRGPIAHDRSPGINNNNDNKRGAGDRFFLFQRISVLLQQFSSILLHDSFVPEDCPEYWTLLQCHFFPNLSGSLIPKVK